MHRRLFGLILILLAVGFINTSAFAQVSSGTQECNEKKERLYAKYEEAVVRVTAQMEEKKARAENIKNSKTAALEVKIARLKANIQERFERCLEVSDDPARCEEKKAKALARVDLLFTTQSEAIQKKFEETIKRIESAFEKKLEQLKKRLRAALEKLAARCGPEFGPDEIPV